MTIACCIDYRFDPHKRAEFEAYCQNWARIIPRCGGDLIGYFMPCEGTNDTALALNMFPDLGAYEAYRQRLREDAEGAENYRFAEENRLILRERRTFLRPAEGHGRDRWGR